GAPDESFIVPYMRPFEIDADGAWLAREWTRVCDTWRWFPWFRPQRAARMPIDQPSIDQLHAYALDYFLAGPAYPSAYAAAMRHDPREALRRVTAPVVVTARADDVLHAHLDRIPTDRAAGVEVLSAPADAKLWREMLSALFDRETGASRSPKGSLPSARFYVGSPQAHVRRFGRRDQVPLLYLHDAPGGAGGDAEWLAALAACRPVLAVDLPGCGCSDPIADASFEGHIAWLGQLIEDLNLARPDIVADGTSGAFALGLAARSPDSVGALVLDGAPTPPPETVRARWRREAELSLSPERCGAHWLRAWHMLRDREAQHPWWDGSAEAIRHREPDIAPERLRQMTLDVLRQSDAWSSALRASLEPDLAALAPQVRSRVLFPSDPGDPRQVGGEALAALIGNATVMPRAASMATRATQYLDFLAAEDL
ncbi:alpha/beta fold hydrolase, partial [Caulobacter segnis]